MRVLIFGVTGMLGNTIFRKLSLDRGNSVYGTKRSTSPIDFFGELNAKNIIGGIDVENADAIIKAFQIAKPEVVINCIGLVKQIEGGNDPISATSINTILPHRLARMCKLFGARFIHFSTDCVFSGSKGLYTEQDYADADDVYGRSKLLGEVSVGDAVTLRTSIIGHELLGNRSLLNWFLAQEGEVFGYSNAIFSGLPTCEVADVLQNFILPNNTVSGLYHLASAPINKFDLLTLIAKVYKKNIKIVPNDSLKINRSLDASRLNSLVAYTPPAWDVLIGKMYEFG
jgi:dTDP-4-dehydrorhamnose reductase